MTLYANLTIIATFTGMTLQGINFIDLPFTWNTAGFSKGNYTLSAYAPPFLGETDTTDSILYDG